MDLSHFVRELRRRRVFRVLAAYAVGAFAVLQVTEPVLHALYLADWVLTAVVAALALGFPVAMALAWVYDLVPGGIERTRPGEGSSPAPGPVVPLLLVGLAAGAPGLAWVLLRRSGAAQVPVWALVGGTLGLVATVAVVAWLVGRRGPEAPPVAAAPGEREAAAGEVPAVAVLPFTDLSPGKDQEYFCDGIAEELLGALCGLSGLRVVARSSSFQFKGRTVDSREIGRTLGANHLLEGSVRKAGSQVRVAARLVDAREGLELWSERFDRELTDVFAVQGEIAQAVARAMRLRLSSREEARLRKRGAGGRARSPLAYEAYLRGRHYLMLHGERGNRLALQAFREAIGLDPAFAEALAGLADSAFMTLHWNLETERPGELRAEALAASEEALRLEPELAEARLARANVLTLLGRHREAEGDFLRAIELNPGWADSCYFYARALVESGRFDDAAGAFEEAARRNPDDYASLCLLVGVHERRKDPGAVRATAVRALAAVERRLHLDPNDDRALYLGATIDVPYGDRARGFQRVERVVELMGDEFAALYNSACFYARAGELSRALDLLDRAVGPGRGSRPWMERDPDLDPLRGDPRFAALMERVRG